jgi:hypothetical protein
VRNRFQRLLGGAAASKFRHPWNDGSQPNFRRLIEMLLDYEGLKG